MAKNKEVMIPTLIIILIIIIVACIVYGITYSVMHPSLTQVELSLKLWWLIMLNTSCGVCLFGILIKYQDKIGKK